MINIKFLKAQNGDCFLISFKDDEEIKRNILIDGGRDSAYFDSTSNSFGDLKSQIDIIKKNNECIDLLVLTHIDNDHILGLLKWFELDNTAYKLIKNTWFNSGKLIANYLKEHENPDLLVGLKIFSGPETGVHEAIDFEKYLTKYNIWKRKIVLKKDTLEEFGVKIKVLSPDDAQLRKLLKEYKTKTGDDAYTAGKEKDWTTLLSTFIEEEAKSTYKFKQDSSVKNGSSITFIITIKDKSFLFLGDSHPKAIVESLLEIGFSIGKPLEVELIKISHHGSKANTNKELLELVKTNNYIISTDSSGDNHPDKRTLARIIKKNPNSVLHFNYSHVKENIMLPQDFIDFPNFKIKVTSELIF